MKSLTFLLAFTLTSTAFGQGLSDKFNNIIKRTGFANSDFGLAVARSNGEMVYNLNGDKKFVPASLSKIPTALAALENLSPTFEFSTQIWRRGEVKGSTLNGDLILKGLGEPALVSERMWYLVNSFIRNEIKVVTGDLIVDESHFDTIRMDKDRLPPSEGRAFDAPVGGLSFNWNSVNVFVRPGDKAGEPAKIFIDPVNDYIIEVQNSVKTVARGTPSIDVKPVQVIKNGEVTGDRLVVTGTIAMGTQEIVKYRSITEPDIWTGRNLKEFLRQRGVVIQGKVKKGKMPPAAVLIVDEAGENVRQAVFDMMKYSNNFIAEMLTKTLSVEVQGAQQGNMNDGIQVILKTMMGAGLAKGEFGFVSPSGLSRKNIMSANQYIKLLSFASRSNYSHEFWSSFPIAGKDGTLKGRMSGLSVRAKTGLLSNVAGLAGQALGKNGEPYLFAFIYNGKNHFEVRDTFDRLCLELTKN